MKNSKRIFLLVGGALLALNACNGRGDEAKQGAAAPQDSTLRLEARAALSAGITVESAQRQSWTETIECPGVIAFDERRLALINPRTSGRIERVFVTEGEAVRAGQELAAIYSPEYLAAQAEFLQIAAGRDRAVAAARPQEENNARQLLAAATSKLKLLGLEQAQIDTLAASRQNSSFLAVRAPWAGSIITSQAITGSPAEVGTMLFKIADTRTLWVKISLAERDLAVLRPGAAARVFVGIFPGREFAGKLTMIAAELDAETRTVGGRVEIANPGLELKPGMFAVVRIDPLEKVQVLAVPGEALCRIDGATFVFVPVGKDHYEKRAVTSGRVFNGQVEIVSGLRAGEQVVSKGSLTLKAELLKSRFAGE
jgi:Cu(I)/Ag(I) efflux system membrane fusion protein